MGSSRTMLCGVAAVLLTVGSAWGQDAKADQDQPKSDPQPSTEDLRYEAVKKGLEAQLKGQEVRVTIQLRNATVQEGIEAFRRQVAGWDFIADLTNFADDYRIDEFIVRDKPWRDAFEAFLAKTGMMIDDERPGLVRFSKPARVTFALKDADIKSVVDLIARISRANIVLAPYVEGKITLSVNDVPWNVVLDTVVKTLGPYVVVRERFDILRIISQAELNKQMETRLFKLVYIQPPPMYRARVEESKQVVGRPPTPATTPEEMIKRFTLLTMLKAVLTRSVDGATILGRIDYDPETNSLAVTDTKVVLDRIGEMLKVLDVEPEQVIIDLKFVRTSNEDLLTFGMNYAFGTEEGFTMTTRPIPTVRVDPSSQTPGTITESPFTVNGLGSVTRLPFGLGQETPTSDTLFLTSFDMLTTFRAFKQDRFSKLMQEPTVSVLDNNEATIFIGEDVPYAEVRSSTNQFGGLDTSISEGSKSPVKVGFTLLVVPRILRQENKVILTIIPTNEVLTGRSPEVVGFEHFVVAGREIDLPRIGRTTLITRLLVESGRTAVLGGLVTERVSYEDRKIPLLGDLPLINPLFRMRNDTITRENLLIFLTPRIARSARESEQNLRAQLRELEELERRRLEEMRLRQVQEELRRADEERVRNAAEEQRQLEEREPK
ncbi:MAG: hypothetical protein HYY16_11070 [Planctomycetes bacterium]|nr:hypothetical protein [Planctomycetota bacterium]